MRRNLAAQRVLTRVEFSSDLSNWELTAVLVSSVTNGDGTVTEIYRCPQLVQNTRRCFLRVIVQRS